MRPVVLRCAMLLSLLSSLSAAGSAGELLPDMTPRESDLKQHRLVLKKGRKLLKFPNTLVNLGEGPLEVRGERQGGRMLAFQMVYSTSGGPQAHPIGEFEYHPQHRHWHLLQVAEYRLLNQQGEEVASSGKVSFCLVDTTLVAPYLPNASGRHYTKCVKSAKAQALMSGISVGWGDKYPASVYGQWIDVTGIPPGEYVLQSVVNPAGIIREITTSNNAVSVPVRIR